MPGAALPSFLLELLFRSSVESTRSTATPSRCRPSSGTAHQCGNVHPVLYDFWCPCRTRTNTTNDWCCPLHGPQSHLALPDKTIYKGISCAENGKVIIVRRRVITVDVTTKAQTTTSRQIGCWCCWWALTNQRRVGGAWKGGRFRRQQSVVGNHLPLQPIV